MTTRRTTDAQIIRSRTGTLPPKPARNVLAWTAAAFFALGWGLGLLCGVMA
jgi:hypothetical protein